MAIVPAITCLLLVMASGTGFPKILWVYWDQGEKAAPFFTKLAIKNKQYYAAKSGWEWHFLTATTIQRYLDPKEINKILSYADDKLVQLKADILRMMLLQKYGGMWMDANSVFAGDLSWVDNLRSDPRVFNKLQSQPQMLIGAYTDASYEGKGNVTVLYDPTYNATIDVFPGYEDWFLLAKPNCSFLQAALTSLPLVLQTSRKKLNKQLQQDGIVISTVHQDPYLVGSDFNFQIVLQTKQKQMDKVNPSNPGYAVDHFKLWHFEANQTVFKLAIKSRWKRNQMWFDMTHLNQEQYRERFGQMPYFWKINGWQWPELSFLLGHYTQFNCWGGNFLIQPGSVFDEKLIKTVRDANLLKDIVAVHENLDNVSFCNSTLSKNYVRTQIEGKIQLAQHSIYLIFLALFLVIYYCCIGVPRPEKNQQQQVLHH